MKRFTLFLLGLFLCLGNTKAQSLIGTWKSITESKGQEIEVFFTFDESTFNMRNVFSINEPSLGIITFSISIPGDYTLLDDKLNIKAKSNKIEFKVEDMKFVGEVADKIRKKPELKERIRKILEKKTKKSKIMNKKIRPKKKKKKRKKKKKIKKNLMKKKKKKKKSKKKK